MRNTISEWREDDASRLAAALAFYSVISVAPLLVLAITIAGFFYGTDTARQQLADQIRGVMGPQASDALLMILQNADKPQTASIAGIIGVIVLLWGASNVFAQLQNAMNVIWDVELKPDADMWVTVKDRLLSFIMVLASGFLLVVSLMLSSVLTFANAQLGASLSGIPWIWQLLNQLVSLLIFTLLFASIFKILPDAEIAWEDVWWGAFATAILFSIGNYLLGIYLGRQGVASAYGAAGSIIVFLLWIYFSAQIFFFGAEFTQVYARRLGRGLRPSENARLVQPQQPSSMQQTT